MVTDARSQNLGLPAADTGPLPEKCLYKIDGSCGICREKCFAQAYRNGVFDRHKCYQICLKNAERHKALGCADVCGKCLAGLPCSSGDPSKMIRR
jgi:hypothetical protein